jgi:hypothetical protein
MKNKILAVAFVVASILLALLVVRRQASGPAMNLRPSAAVGEVLAEEAVRLLGGTGNIVVIGRASSKDCQTAGDEQLSSFGAALRRRASPRIAAIEWLSRPPGPMMNTGDLTAEQLLQLIEKNPAANAIVIFTGLPPLSPDLAEKLAARPLKLLAVCGCGATVRHWLETRALAVAVVPRFGEPPPGAPVPKTTKDWLRQEFEMLTPESVAQLPY